jgi:hypothetical protein
VLVLTQFLFRLSFGMALAMAVTPARRVTSGYYRNHLYVLLGLNVLATLVAVGRPDELPLWPPLAAAVLSYVGSVCWLYEKPRPGVVALALVAATTLVGAWWAAGLFAAPARIAVSHRDALPATALAWLDPVTGGLVLGVTIAAMFLGHWYLNTPTMRIDPLKRLVQWMAAAVLLRGVACGTGLALEILATGAKSPQWLLFVLLRWLAGIAGALLLSWMTWRILTQERPNTQSATGILYVAVIVTFLGELVSLLLSAETSFPV